MDKKAKFFWTDVVKDLNKIFGVDHCKLVHPKKSVACECFRRPDICS